MLATWTKSSITHSICGISTRAATAHIAPGLICAELDRDQTWTPSTCPPDGLFDVARTGADRLVATIDSILSLVQAPDIDLTIWEASPYKPTPTIIEATLALYRGHSVTEISRTDAGATNLGTTAEALARDTVRCERLRGHSIRKGKALSEVKAVIQNVHHFRDECLIDVARPPVEHVAIFDEARRAWNLKQTADFMKREKRRADFNLSVRLCRRPRATCFRRPLVMSLANEYGLFQSIGSARFFFSGPIRSTDVVPRSRCFCGGPCGRASVLDCRPHDISPRSRPWWT